MISGEGKNKTKQKQIAVLKKCGIKELEISLF